MSLTPQQKAFYFIAYKETPQTIDQLINQLPANEQSELKKLHESLAKHNPSQVRSVINSELRKLSKTTTQSFLSEVHDDWIVELLKKETPEMVSTVLRYLPAEKVQVILDALPHDLVASMPKLSDTYAIPEALVGLLKGRFEGLYKTHKTDIPKDKIEYNHLSLLRADQIDGVFMELGYREIALALQTLPSATQVIVIGRVSANDQAHVRVYMDKAPLVSKQRIKKAQGHLVRQDITSKDPKLFVKELGFVIYAKTVLGNHMDDVDVIKYKMSQLEAGEFMGLVDSLMGSNTEASVLEYQEDVILAIKRVLLRM